MNPSCGIHQLCHELMLHIFCNLSASDIAPATLVCREWNVLLKDKLLWKFFFHRDYQVPEVENPKEIYQKKYRFNRNLVRGIYSLRVIRTGKGTKSDRAYVKGGKLFVPKWSGEIEIWDLEKGALEKKLPGDKTTAMSLVVTEEGGSLRSLRMGVSGFGI